MCWKHRKLVISGRILSFYGLMVGGLLNRPLRFLLPQKETLVSCLFQDQSVHLPNTTEITDPSPTG